MNNSKWIAVIVIFSQFLILNCSSIQAKNRIVGVYYGVPENAATYDYVIITNKTLAYANNYKSNQKKFQDLCDSKAAKGLSACIVTTDWINANYDGNKPSGGEDLQTKIRNFLIDAYQSWRTKYCLLAGADEIVPARKFYISGLPHREPNCYPSDLYYSCLDPNCSFDGNRDNNYGQINDGANGGEVDFKSEIYVGRACVESVNEVHNFLNKNFKYIESQDNYLDYFSAVATRDEDGDDYKIDAECVRVDSNILGIPRVGFKKRTLPNSRDFNVDQYVYAKKDMWDPRKDILPLLNGQKGYTTPHIIYYAGHGFQRGIIRLIPAQPQWLQYPLFEVDTTEPCAICIEDLTNGNNDRYFFLFLDCSFTGKFDSNDCFAEELTTRPNGAFAVIAASEIEAPDPDGGVWPATIIGAEFFNLILDDANVPSLGRALQNARENAIKNRFAVTSFRLAYCEMTLFGDPELTLRVQKEPARIGFNQKQQKK